MSTPAPVRNVMLATNIAKFKDHRFLSQARGSWVASIKYDGERAVWRNGGLWSSYGNKIYAPADWIEEHIPNKRLEYDGELYLGRGQFDALRSIVSRTVNFLPWTGVRYMIFEGDVRLGMNMFDISMKFGNVVRIPVKRMDHILELYQHEIDLGGEGLMLRDTGSWWVPKRVRSLVKLKAEEIVLGTVISENEGGDGRVGKIGSVVVHGSDGVTGTVGSGLRGIDHAFGSMMGRSVKIRFMGYTPSGVWRMPRIVN